MMDLSQLNQEQQEAVETIDGPMLILAGAGSGKTRVVTHRIVHLIQSGVPSWAILGLTFTNKAAGEMRERVEKLCEQRVLISTFHSLGVRILRESIGMLGYPLSFSIYDEEDSLKLIRVCLSDLERKEAKGMVREIKQAISRAKNQLQNPEECLGNEEWIPVYARYQEKLKECHAVDFDDLLFLTVRLFREYPEALEKCQQRWKYLLIDEYQDTNEAQYELVQMLVKGHNNIFVVGDPDQSIYSWRGANIGNILNFERDYPGAKIIRLEQNYRSRCNILQAANELISNNEGRYEKTLWSERGEGEPIKQYLAYDEREEAQFVTRVIHRHYTEGTPYSEIVLFYRTNAQSRPLEDQLLQNGIPYIIYGGISFYQRKEIKDILAFMRMVYSGADFVSFARTINLPKRGIGDTSLEKIRQEAFHAGMPIFDWCQALIDGTVQPKTMRPTKKVLSGLAEYLNIINMLRETSRDESLSHLVMTTIQSSGYFEVLKQDPDSFEDRKENLDELISKAIEWEQNAENPNLGDFLEELSLKSSMDIEGPDRDRVCLMTLHNGKGLEFSVTCIVGMEEDLLPHANSRNDPRALEEERRLCYVGMTRAKDILYFTHAETRYIWGSPRFQRPSRFIREVPPKYRQKIHDV